MEKELEIDSHLAAEPGVTDCTDVQTAIEEYASRGFRMDMIFPADSPRAALLSRGTERIRLRSSGTPGSGEIGVPRVESEDGSNSSKWVEGRAGMQYRDLIPDRLGGKTVASHIRLAAAGVVADYVHYHKLDFQMIYCLKGRIRVVYEDQGPPFWLETGDCVVQPPEIRHRVLECTAGAEVLEISMPAEHETWVDHEMSLPNDVLNPNREFCGQRFVITKSPAI